MQRERKIKALSRILKYAALSMMFLLPIVNAGFWITSGFPFWGAIDWHMIPSITQVATPALAEMTAMMKFYGFLVNLIPTGVSMIVLYYLARLFKLYEDLEIFSERSVKCLRHLGFALLAGQLLHPIYSALITLTVTMANPAGERLISISFGTEELKIIAISAIVILISWIMDIACQLQEEQAATI